MKETILSVVSMLLFAECDIKHCKDTGDTIITAGDTQMIIPTVSYKALEEAINTCNQVGEALLLKPSPEQDFLNSIDGDVTFANNSKRN